MVISVGGADTFKQTITSLAKGAGGKYVQRRNGYFSNPSSKNIS